MKELEEIKAMMDDRTAASTGVTIAERLLYVIAEALVKLSEKK